MRDRKTFSGPLQPGVLNPVTGESSAAQLDALWRSRQNVVAFLYRFHYSLQIPNLGSNRWAVAARRRRHDLELDCFIGFYLTCRCAAANPARPEAVAKF